MAKLDELHHLHTEICQCLADPKRLLIIMELGDQKKSVSELTTLLGLRQTTISQHLAILRQRGMVETEKKGVHVYYYLSYPEILQAIEIMRKVLAQQLAKKKLLLDLCERDSLE